MPRFVILEHNHPHRHWDLMLECGAVLWTWRLPRLPCRGAVLDADRISDHRLAYLDYEGPISGNRGAVIRREQGEFAWLVQDEEVLEVCIQGSHLQGVLRLMKTEEESWRLEWLP